MTRTEFVRVAGAARRAFRVASGLVVVGLLSSCTESAAIVEAATAPVESVTRATQARRALTGSYTVESITLETRYWDARSPLPSTATAASVFNSLDYTRPGYTNEPYLMPSLAPSFSSMEEGWVFNDTLWTGISNPAGASTNIATRYRVTVNALTQSDMLVQFAVDFRGGAMYLDGSPVPGAEGWSNLWWNGSFQVDTNSYVGCVQNSDFLAAPCLPEYTLLPSTLAATVSLSPGIHYIEVIGFEDGNDGGAAARIDVGNGFQPLVASVQPAQVLTVQPPGSGGGRVVSSPAGIDCPGACTAQFPLASSVTLTASVSPNFVFAGWTGACSGNGPCSVSMYGGRTVGANFVGVPSVQSMSIETRYWDLGSFTQTGTGANSYFNTLPTDSAGFTNEAVPVTSFVKNTALFAPSEAKSYRNLASRYVTEIYAPTAATVQFRFGGDMSHGGAMLLDGTEIATNWTNQTGSPFLFATVPLAAGNHTITVVGFENCCDGATPLLEYSLGAGWIATQAPPPAPTPLTIAIPNAGGRVVSNPAGIDCAPTCQASFATGSQVVLTAVPDPYFVFAGWGGACTGIGTCAVRMLAPSRSVTANFTRAAWPVTVTTSGSGGGTVSSDPVGTSCGPNCFVFAANQPVTFRAIPDGRSEFAGWNVPGCSGLTCTVTVSGALVVSAQFNSVVALTVTGAGTGTGTITSSPAGIDCGTTCAKSFATGTVVTLTATAVAGSTFTGWSGACSGTGTCVITMSRARTVTATFALNRFALSVTKVGSGTVTSSPPGISCGAQCGAEFTFGTVVTLTAVAGTGYSFTGWSGACTGTSTCTVTIDRAQSVTATFTAQRFELSVATNGTGAGTVTSSVGGINCGSNCATSLDFGTQVTLTATAGAGSAFAGWAGACSGTGPCLFTMTQATTVTATFNVATPVSSCVATPREIWPPNHKMVAVSIKPLPGGYLLQSVTSSEPDDAQDGGAPGDDARGDGNTINDVQRWSIGTASFSGLVRAERDGRGTGRTYSFVYSNGSETASCSVFVPHSQGK